jgi:hypothetical protein
VAQDKWFPLAKKQILVRGEVRPVTVLLIDRMCDSGQWNGDFAA